MKVGMALKRNKVKPRQPNKHEGTENAKSPQFKQIESRDWEGSRKSWLAEEGCYKRLEGIMLQDPTGSGGCVWMFCVNFRFYFCLVLILELGWLIPWNTTPSDREPYRECFRYIVRNWIYSAIPTFMRFYSTRRCTVRHDQVFGEPAGFMDPQEDRQASGIFH